MSMVKLPHGPKEVNASAQVIDLSYMTAAN